MRGREAQLTGIKARFGQGLAEQGQLKGAMVMSGDTWEQARAQVKKLREMGYTDRQIRNAALRRGWSEEQVNRLLPGQTQPVPPPPPEPAGSAPPWASTATARHSSRQATPVSRPVGVTMVVLLADVGALLQLLFCAGVVVAVVVGNWHHYIPAEEMDTSIVMGVLTLVSWLVGAGVLVVSHFLWNGFNWARVTFMGLLGLSALQNLVGVAFTCARYGIGAYAVVSLLAAGICVVFIIILNGRGARAYCTR